MVIEGVLNTVDMVVMVVLIDGIVIVTIAVGMVVVVIVNMV